MVNSKQDQVVPVHHGDQQGLALPEVSNQTRFDMKTCMTTFALIFLLCGCNVAEFAHPLVSEEFLTNELELNGTWTLSDNNDRFQISSTKKAGVYQLNYYPDRESCTEEYYTSAVEAFSNSELKVAKISGQYYIQLALKKEFLDDIPENLGVKELYLILSIKKVDNEYYLYPTDPKLLRKRARELNLSHKLLYKSLKPNSKRTLLPDNSHPHPYVDIILDCPTESIQELVRLHHERIFINEALIFSPVTKTNENKQTNGEVK